ncbi:cell division protein FtsH [Anaeromassilibacillus sp. An172]|uniref:ATP-dependent zinc metalloprotease FtsH n=1 Tax=Anaeromassilibacillus sp. An172 TaxID=1965570 RepID=UPI000B36A63C|nr:ATP-dependent zinc metalloprotease FtsH [Anaeromassilibacillus sp. An172]OUP78986.1 cell division protein FtsH [Anaeromassilibacillus sp. An172]
MNKNKQIKNLLLYLGLPILVILLLLFFLRGGTSNTMTYSDVLYLFEEQKVEEFSVDAGTGVLTMKLEEGAKIPSLEDKQMMQNQGFFGEGNSSSNLIVEYKLASVDLFYSDVKEYIDEYNADKPDSEKLTFDIQRAADRSIWLEMLPTLIMFVIIGVFWFILMKKMGAGLGGKEMTFGKAKFKNSNDEKKKTTFADVAGADEEKEELEEIVQFLKTPEKYNKLGAKIPKGVLLVGPPGTGKTLLARAVAGEAGVPFFSISGSDFVEMFVGVGASRVRDLFDTAKKNSPCIVFIDEIDAVGRQRGAGLGGGNDEREQTLNQLLVEMDGFGANEGVIVIAATNRPDVLDPAILRPGRFDRQVVVGYPDINGREAILKVHAREKPLAPDVNLRTIASSTAGFTGADLENVLNEAALLAARKNKRAITMEEIEEATIKVVVGTEKKSKVMSDKEKKLTAYHEAGHAICTQYCPTQDPVHQISIIPRGRAGGYTMSLPTEDKTYSSRNEMLEDIVVLLGGRVAEALIMGDISTGASNDIERATSTAKSMVTKYGMSDVLGPVCYGSGNNEVFIGRDMGQVKDYSEETAAKIDQEILRIVNNGYKACEKLLKDHIDQLHNVAQYLIKHEKMSGDEFRAMVNGTFEEKAPLPEGEY